MSRSLKMGKLQNNALSSDNKKSSKKTDDILNTLDTCHSKC